MRIPYFALTDHVSTGTLRGGNDVLNYMLILLMGGEASALIVGGPSRIQGEQFTVAREFPGAPYSWAIVLLVAVVLFAVGVAIPDDDHYGEHFLSSRGVLICSGAFLCALWCFALAYSLFASGRIFPTQVSYSGPWLWSCIGLLFVLKVGQHMDLRYVGGGDEKASST